MCNDFSHEIKEKSRSLQNCAFCLGTCYVQCWKMRVRSGNVIELPFPSAPKAYLALRHLPYATDYFNHECSISLWIWSYHWAFTVTGLFKVIFLNQSKNYADTAAMSILILALFILIFPPWINLNICEQPFVPLQCELEAERAECVHVYIAWQGGMSSFKLWEM